MKASNVRWITISTCAVLAVFLAQAQSGGSTGNTPQNQASGQVTLQMHPVNALLSKSLDARKTKSGAVVTAKLEHDLQQPDAQELPKNTVLEGHVDQVQTSQNKSDSVLVVTFDKARLKTGQEVPIKATVLAIAKPADMEQQQQVSSAAMMPAAGAGPMSSGGGGVMSQQYAGRQMGNIPAPETLPAGGPASMADPANSAPQKNGLPGVTLTSDIHQQASATFTASHKNVYLPEGMRMQVAIVVIPKGVTAK